MSHDQQAIVGDPLDMLTAYQHSAVIAAACRTGIADAIAAEPLDANGAADICGTDPRGTQALLGALTALGLAEHTRMGYQLSQAGSVLAAEHPETIAAIVEKEWFFYRVWLGLEDTIRDGHARIPPWRDRLRTAPAQSHMFLRALDDLAARFGDELPGLSGVTAGRLLDIGGGAGSHAARLASTVPSLDVVVLDLPEVEPVLRQRHPELQFVAGDLDESRFGRPEGETWDHVLLANILHDQPPERCRAILAEAAVLLAPGGSLILYEWVLGEDRDSPIPVALFALMMMVENEGGATYTESELIGWLQGAGLKDVEVRRGSGPIAAVRAACPR